MGLITAMSPFFVLKHEKHLYSVNSERILQLAGRFPAYQGKLQLQSHNLIFNTQMREIQHHINQAITIPLSNNHKRTLTPGSSLIEQECLSGTRY